jgi:hypothetical protein
MVANWREADVDLDDLAFLLPERVGTAGRVGDQDQNVRGTSSGCRACRTVLREEHQVHDEDLATWVPCVWS